MVLRYWGDQDVQADDFAPLVDRERGGITTGDLVGALGSRGAVVHPISAEPEDARREIANGRPVIALIDGGGGSLHYVVIVAWASDRVLYHDPSVGPFRVQREGEFLRLWKATGGFALVVTPGATPFPTGPPAPLSPVPSPATTGECDPLVEHAIGVARGPDPELAVPELLAAREMCPSDARPLGALAGVRFRQKRWTDAADFARQAAARNAEDPDNWRLLGASLYLSDEPRAALAAWNRIDEPRLDGVQIDGLIRTRQDVATAALGLHPRDVLTLESINGAERRLDQLPTSMGGKVTYRPLAGGRADVVASVGETGLLEPGLILALRLGIEAGARREGRIRINSPTGRGEALEIGGRFASNRPAAWAALETPRLGGLPGVVSLSGLWDRQTYRLVAPEEASLVVETRSRGAIDWSRWSGSSTRIDLGLGIERFDRRRSYGSVRAGVDVRLAKDRLALLGDAATWAGIGDATGFAEFGVTVAHRGGVRPRRVTWNIRADARRATRDAPLALWPGAGTGAGRTFLLRASPLIENGELVGYAFGRGLLHGTVELEVRVADRALARLGLAAFADWARPWDATPLRGAGPGLFAIGAGLRIHALASAAFRIDVARRPGKKGVVLSAGVIPAWPR